MFDYYDKINILIMPTDACNMNCIYCYHEAHFNDICKMTDDTLRQIMKITIPNYKDIHFIWHGGEPLIMGIEFFEKALYYEKKYNTSNCNVTNGIQTNLTLLNSGMADFLIKNKFSIGSSYDGIENDITRGNSDKILTGRKLLNSYGKICGNIMVVSRKNVDTLIESYEFFKKEKISYKMNSYVKTDDSSISNELSMNVDYYSDKMIELYDYWLHDTQCNIYVNPFISIIKHVLFGYKKLCSQNSCLGKWLGIRHDGTITNCNRFFYPKYLYGNVRQYNNIREAFDSQGFNNVLLDAVERRNKCKSCQIYDYCNGGCNNAAMFETGMNNNGGFSCISKINIYTYISKSINEILANDFNEIQKMYNPTVVKLIQRKMIS